MISLWISNLTIYRTKHSQYSNLQQMYSLRSYLSAVLLALTSFGAVNSRETALKTNLLYDATATVNIGLEQAIAPKWSIDLSGNLNAWNMHDGARWKHWLVQPEARYWFCQALDGHFLAAHLVGGQYNVGSWSDGGLWNIKSAKLANNRYQGWFVGAGIGYGYSWMLAKHWNLEAEIAVGYAYSRYDRFECEECGREIESKRNHHYVGPTKAAISLVYVF